MTPIVNRLTQLGLGAVGTSGRLALRPYAGEDPADDSDRSLLQQYVATSSEQAFSQIVYRHSGWVYHTCRRNLRDVHLAEDATQAVFLLLSRKAASIKSETHLGGWLFQACRYVLADIRKSQARYVHRRNLACDLSLQRAASVQRLEADPDPVLSAAVDEAIAGLRENDRQTILMHFYEGMTLRQMAAKLAITREGAKKRVMRALARLRGRLAGRVHTAARGTILPVAALVLLLRTRAAEAAPADFVAATARSVTVPGLSSTFAEIVAESVRRSAVRGTERLLTRLALTALSLSLLTVASMPFRSFRNGSEPTALAGTVARPGSSASQSRSVKGLTASAASLAVDDINPGLPYERPIELVSTSPLLLDVDPSPARPEMPAAHAPARVLALGSASTVLSTTSTNVAGTSAVMTAAIPATPAVSPLPQRVAEPLWLTTPLVVAGTAPALGSTTPTVPIRPHTPPPGFDDHRPPDPGDAHAHPQPAGPGGPTTVADGTSYWHGPDMAQVGPLHPRHADPVPENYFVVRSPEPPPPGSADWDSGWMMPPPMADSSGKMPPALRLAYSANGPVQVRGVYQPGSPADVGFVVDIEPGAMHPVSFIPPTAHGKTVGRGDITGLPDAAADWGFIASGKRRPDLEILAGMDPESPVFAMDMERFAVCPDLAAEPAALMSSWRWDDLMHSAVDSFTPDLALAAATPLHFATETVVVPEPTGTIALMLAFIALGARRRR